MFLVKSSPSSNVGAEIAFRFIHLYRQLDDDLANRSQVDTAILDCSYERLVRRCETSTRYLRLWLSRLFAASTSALLRDQYRESVRDWEDREKQWTCTTWHRQKEKILDGLMTSCHCLSSPSLSPSPSPSRSFIISSLWSEKDEDLIPLSSSFERNLRGYDGKNLPW